MTAAYMQILIHAVNPSLFPDADPNAASWAGPPPGIVTVQSLLYTSLATSLFAAFLAMFGKQWINHYLRRHGGSAVEKSRDRQRKIDGLERWHFRLVIESLPVMLQIALLLLGCALSKYLWTINHTVAGFILAFTAFGVATYTFFTLAASLSYGCPYQTPLSAIIRGCVEYIGKSHSTFARSLQSLTGSLATICSHSAVNLRQILQRLQSSARGVLCSFGHTTALPQETPQIPLAIVTAPTRIFKENQIDWDSCKADTRCITWVLHSTTDSDVIYSTVRFAADTIWYPEIARAISPHILANLFFDCLLDGQVIPGKSEHATSIGMALGSVLSVHLCVEPEGEGLKELCEHIISGVQLVPGHKSMFELVVRVLRFVAQTPSPIPNGSIPRFLTSDGVPQHSPTTHKLWFSRVILQTVWRWRRVQDPTTVLRFYPLESIHMNLMADGDEKLIILGTNCVLTMAILMGLVADFHDLYAPVDRCVIYPCLPSNSLIVIMLQRCTGHSYGPSPPTLTTGHQEADRLEFCIHLHLFCSLLF